MLFTMIVATKAGTAAFRGVTQVSLWLLSKTT
jgi:hypothetical protein